MINQSITSPNFDPDPIPVEFVVLHYTACNLKRTFDIFCDASKEVSSHLVIAEDGEVFELVRCWAGTAYRAWHAGSSRWNDGQKSWDNFNDFSIGIEIVNLNGNVFSYTHEQYTALARVMEHLISKYPSLESPDRIVGHEQIASRRGKVDPGTMFDWARFFHLVYPNNVPPFRVSICPTDLAVALKTFANPVPKDAKSATEIWESLSYLTETSVRLIQDSKEN